MSEMKHTEEPWELVLMEDGPVLMGGDGQPVLYSMPQKAPYRRPPEEQAANMRRMGVCVSAMVGVPNEAVEEVTFRLGALIRQRDAFLAIVEAYEQWEADLLQSQEAWSGGLAPLPTLTEELFDRLLEIQAMRNAAIASANGK
jgi:hypothetical protein